MIRLVFQGGGLSAGTLSVGPSCFFRIGGNFIHEGRDRTVVGSYRNHYWEVNGQHFTRYGGNGPVTLSFENVAGEPSESFGPFDRFWCADGVLYAEDKLFAKFIEEAQLWHCYLTDTYWPTLVISSLDCA